MGGGRQMLYKNVANITGDLIDEWANRREDDLNLIETWKMDKKNRSKNFEFVENTEQLDNIDHNNIDFLLGIFANGHLPMDYKRDTSPKGQPSLEQMTTAAIKVLRKNKNGYLLVVSYFFK